MSSGVIDISEVLDDLSALDRAILRGARSGLSSKQIARLVDRSPHTVDDRMKALRRRLGASDRAQAGRMLIAFEAGLDPLKDWGGQSLALTPVAQADIDTPEPRWGSGDPIPMP